MAPKGTLLKKFVQEECSSGDFDFVGRFLFLLEFDSCPFESKEIGNLPSFLKFISSSILFLVVIFRSPLSVT